MVCGLERGGTGEVRVVSNGEGGDATWESREMNGPGLGQGPGLGPGALV